MDDLRHREAQLAVLSVLGKSKEFREAFVLKGAMQVEAITQMSRSTRDLDLTVKAMPYSLDDAGRKELRRQLDLVLRPGIRNAPPAGEWALVEVGVTKRPRGPRPGTLGHDGFRATITLHRRGAKQTPVIVDFSSGDLIGPPVAVAFVDGRLALARDRGGETVIYGYSAEEAIAEKLRAFLQKLPAHLSKIGRAADEKLRVRDICDVAQMIRVCEGLDWPQVADKFAEKCRRRDVDCAGPDDFLALEGGLATIEAVYESEDLHRNLPFSDAWSLFWGAVERVRDLKGMPIGLADATTSL